MNNLPRGVKVFNHLLFPDSRGYLSCIYEKEETIQLEGFSCKISKSLPNVARGIHWQNQMAPQTKAITVLKGSIIDFLVDLDRNSKDFGKLFSFELDEESSKTIYIPSNYGHGFYAKENTTFLYCCFGRYSEENEITINLSDLVKKQTNIDNSGWILSKKDINAQNFEYLFKT